MSTHELRLQLVIDPTFSKVTPDAVTFETGADPEEVADTNLLAYEHHGEGFAPGSPGALTLFYQDLIFGVPMPLTLAMHQVAHVDSILAAALFCRRELVVHPAMPGIVYGAELYHRFGLPALAHVPEDLGRFFQLLVDFFPSGLNREETGNRLVSAIGWVHEYLFQGTLPHLGSSAASFRILEVGSDGFVIAESARASQGVWVEVFRKGHLRGVLFGPEKDGFRSVLVAKKTPRLAFDLEKAAGALNELEFKAGGNPEWVVDGLFLTSPPEGTVILPSILVQVFLRC